jgi:hypothetical protein
MTSFTNALTESQINATLWFRIFKIVAFPINAWEIKVIGKTLKCFLNSYSILCVFIYI